MLCHMTQADRLVVVTGGTSGLGRQLASRLTSSGTVQVLLTGRSEQAARTVASGIGARGAALDLGSLASVRAFAEEVRDLTGGRPLHALVANAGLQVTRRTTTADGFETTFGVNHVGHVALVEELLRLTGPPSRLVLVASGTHDPAQRTGMPAPLEAATAEQLAHPAPRTAADESEATEARRRYATAKLAAVRTAGELSRRLAGTTSVFSVDPGLMPGTGLVRTHGALQRALWVTAFRLLVVLPGVQTPARAARQVARLVLDEEVPPTGTYVVRGRPGLSSAAARDTAAQRALYEDTLELIAAARAAG